MKDTDAIVMEVRKALIAKQKEIDTAGNAAISYVKDAFKKRQKEFITFERSAGGLTCTDSQRPSSVIESLKKDAIYLLAGINSILV